MQPPWILLREETLCELQITHFSAWHTQRLIYSFALRFAQDKTYSDVIALLRGWSAQQAH